MPPVSKQLFTVIVVLAIFASQQKCEAVAISKPGTQQNLNRQAPGLPREDIVAAANDNVGQTILGKIPELSGHASILGADHSHTNKRADDSSIEGQLEIFASQTVPIAPPKIILPKLRGSASSIGNDAQVQSPTVQQVTISPVNSDSKWARKQRKSVERREANYGMGDMARRSGSKIRRSKRSLVKVGKPDFWEHRDYHMSDVEEVAEAVVKGVNRVFRSPSRSLRQMRSLGGHLFEKRELTAGELHDAFMWVFTLLWIVFGSAILFAVTMDDWEALYTYF